MLIIKVIQETLRKTQLDIAEDLGVSRQTISMWLSGYKMSKKHIITISKVYHIPINYIEKSQVTGSSFSKEEIDFIKSCLLEQKMNYSGDLVFELLKLIGSNKSIASSNFNDLIEDIDYSKIDVHEYDKNSEFDNSHNYIIIAKIKDKSLLDALSTLDPIINNYKNVAYIISNGNQDNIKVISFGGSE